MTPAATAATAWGRSITRPRAWTATAWADPGGGGPADQNVELATGIGYILSPDRPMVILARLLGGETRFDLAATDPELADLVKLHPGFRDARSTVLHRFGVDPDYSRWRATFRSQSRPAPPRPDGLVPPPRTSACAVSVPRLATRALQPAAPLRT